MFYVSRASQHARGISLRRPLVVAIAGSPGDGMARHGRVALCAAIQGKRVDLPEKIDRAARYFGTARPSQKNSWPEDKAGEVVFSDEMTSGFVKRKSKRIVNSTKAAGANDDDVSDLARLSTEESNRDVLFSDEMSVAKPKRKRSSRPKDAVPGDGATPTDARAGKSKANKNVPSTIRFPSVIPPAFEVDITKLQAEIDRMKRTVFGIDGPFRENQLEAIISASRNKHVFYVVPTGTGKSLVFQLPAILQPPLVASPGPTVVISPLKALMEDQAKHMSLLPEIRFGMLHGEVHRTKRAEILSVAKDLDIILVTPEQMLNQTVIDAVKAAKARRFVFDEAHCIFEWGRGFRPKYRTACEVIRESFPSVPWTMLTATAPEDVRTFVCGLMGEGSAEVLDTFVAKVAVRSNLDYLVRAKHDDFEPASKQLFKLVAKSSCAIVFCLTKDECDQVVAFLNLKMPNQVSCYHAGMSTAAKKAHFEQWRMGLTKVMVATSAFGMGVNIAHVRHVIHFSMPMSLTSYVQQCGRAGRDNAKAECILLFSSKDGRRARWMAESSGGSAVDVDEMMTFSRASGCVKKVLENKLSGTHLDVTVKCKSNCQCRE